MESSPTKTPFSMPLPKIPMDELFDRVRESLEKMDRREAEKKRRREALEEKRWRERCKRSIDDKTPLFPTWASAGALSSEPLDNDDEELERTEPLEADAVGSSSSAKGSSSVTEEDSSSAKEEDSSSEPPYRSKYFYLPPEKTKPEPVPEEELKRRRKVEEELIALSKKITEENLRKERMKPLVWNKPIFDPFSSSDTSNAADSSDGAASSGSKEPESKKPRRNLSTAYYGYGGYDMGFGCFRKQHTKEEIDDFVAFVDKWIPTDPKWRKKRSRPGEESSKDDEKEE
eukprot:scaffold2532_cov79-Skeletonema_menzelii.AAC.27